MNSAAFDPGLRGRTYEELCSGFSWRVPSHLNMGVLCADRHPVTDLALVELDPTGARRERTFGQVAADSNRLANALVEAAGIEQGDRVGIVLPQRLETALCHLALYKLGGVALPLSGLFGPDALRHRLGDSGARAVVTDADHLESLSELAGELGFELICVDPVARPHHSFWDLVDAASPRFDAVVAAPDTPALLIYTSGTTGSAKGALHGHRVLHGHLPGFELSHDFFGSPDDCFWTPADWAWIGGLLDGLLPSWFHGRPVVASRQVKFDPEWTLSMIERERVRNVFLPPTALKVMRQSDVGGRVGLRTIGCGGETLGDEILSWTRERLGVTINEFYGQTEANLLVGNCAASWDVRPGSMGRPYPGHQVAILGEDGHVADPGAVGQIALRAPDPVLMLGYWNNPEGTRAKFTPDGSWLLTGDLATADEDGYIWYQAREDDVISSAGYRIGPAEIEACLMRHPAVAMAAAVGVPDEVRGESVKAFLVLADDREPSVELENEIRELVRRRLAAYLYPRRFEFVAELPLTTTGKIRRKELKAREIAPSADGNPDVDPRTRA